jgi:hypothetical protein
VHQLAKLLKGYKVFPRTCRFGTRTPKGYRRDDLDDPIARYLPPEPATAPQAGVPAPPGGTEAATPGPAVADRERPEARESAPCCGVAGQEGVAGEEATRPEPPAATGEAHSDLVDMILAIVEAPPDARRETGAGGGPPEGTEDRRDDE